MTDLDWIVEITATLFDPTCCYFRRRDLVVIPANCYQADNLRTMWQILADDPLMITSISDGRIYLQWAASLDTNHGGWITFERAEDLGLRHR